MKTIWKDLHLISCVFHRCCLQVALIQSTGQYLGKACLQVRRWTGSWHIYLFNAFRLREPVLLLQSTWMREVGLTVFTMGEFGLENRPGQLFKWRFKLTLSCRKSNCLDANAAAKKLCVGGWLFVSSRGLVPGYLVLWELVRAVLPVDSLSSSRLLRGHHVLWVQQQGWVPGASFLQVSTSQPWHVHIFSVITERMGI